MISPGTSLVIFGGNKTLMVTFVSDNLGSLYAKIEEKCTASPGKPRLQPCKSLADGSLYSINISAFENP